MTKPLPAQPRYIPAPRSPGMVGTGLVVGEGQEIFAQGAVPHGFFRVLSGVVRVCRVLGDGRRQILGFYAVDDVFGLDFGSERQHYAEAVNDCTLLSFRRRAVEALAQENAAIGQQLFLYAMQDLVQTRNHVQLLGRRSAAEKLAGFLLALSLRATDRHMVTLVMTRQDIGDYLGLTIETVSRSLSQFERQGLIALSNIRDVHLLNLPALEEISA